MAVIRGDGERDREGVSAEDERRLNKAGDKEGVRQGSGVPQVDLIKAKEYAP